jgi:CRP-like cAMP-binding protein
MPETQPLQARLSAEKARWRAKLMAETLMISTDWDIVDRTPIFRSMGRPLSRHIINTSASRSYERNEQIFQQGDPAACFFLVLEGWVKLHRVLPNGDDVVVALCSPGETFAEAVMFLGGRYPVSAEAVSPARLLRVNGTVLRQLILENPEIAFGMLASSSVHLRNLIGQIEQLKRQSAPKRIASFLLSLAKASSGSVQITLPCEKSLIASRLGMTPESFSRALRRLSGLGVAVQREQIDIEDVGRIAAYVRQGEMKSGRATFAD